MSDPLFNTPPVQTIYTGDPSAPTVTFPATVSTAGGNWFDGFISRNAKSLSALLIAGLGWGGQVIHSKSQPITATEWYELAVAVATALGVYGAKNTPTA